MITLSSIDKLILSFDRALRTLSSSAGSQRSTPDAGLRDVSLSTAERQHSAGLMRVNHAGEVSAQALYQGQALTARNEQIRKQMQHSAIEENDHLAWCEQRVYELNSHTSYLNPLWYVGSLSIGIMAGIVGDRWSLGFLVETERQVVKHLDSHLLQLPKQDQKSRRIVEQMREDEAQHATVAMQAGAAELPEVVKKVMRVLSKVMTTTAYYV